MFHFPFKKNRKPNNDQSAKPPEQVCGNSAGADTEGGKTGAISAAIDDNLKFLSNYFGSGIGLHENKYEFSEYGIQFGLVYIDSITDKELIRNDVLLPLLRFEDKLKFQSPDHVLGLMQSRILTATHTQVLSNMDEVTQKLVSGYTVLFLEGGSDALVIGSRKVEKKAIEVPANETTVLGSQESFNDDLTTNTCLILKRLPVPKLRIEEYTLGRLSQTKAKLVWLDGIADPNIIQEAKNRLGRIDIDNVDGIGALAQLIEDKAWSIFPKFRQTERPDMTVKGLTDGRFAILCDNSPFAFVAPISFWECFKTMDDYQDKPIVSSYLRIIRYVGFLLATLISSLYLAFVTYNQVIIPPSLALNIAAGREGVPFPSVLELLLLTFLMTIIREAGLRLTGSVGYFIGTLAAVVIGQAVVTAGYLSAALIIIVAVSTIANFAVSTTTLVYPAKLLNYYFILLAGMFGIFGIVNGLVFLYWHLVSLSSFGVPYLNPVVPFDKDGFKDTFIHFSFGAMKKRMKRLAPQNRVRVGEGGIIGAQEGDGA
ncbi:Spore germination protein B1 [bioreactor metagenome]|uniref:Spore germination protein B1 n=1 Tax=bioreactor metagenome TaxID=1076179 RepID=A0A644WNJ5_9ZZZZ